MDKPVRPQPTPPSPTMAEINRQIEQIEREERWRARRTAAVIVLVLSAIIAAVTWLNVRQTREENRVLDHYSEQQGRLERQLAQPQRGNASAAGAASAP